MAKNFMSSILDELMGRDRNALPDEQPKKLSWDDPEMCSHYLVCFCPHELFVNTKADLGPCPKLHDEQLRKKYLEEAPNNRRIHFEGEFIRFAEKMIQDIEAKIKRGKMRIALANGPDGGTYAGPGSKNAEKIALLTDRVNVLLKEAEEAGCDGDVEKAQGLLKLCETLKEERESLKSNEVNHPWNPDKAMQVCEVCGSYLIIGEAQHRLDDHIMGKQHVGFAMLRKTMEDIRKTKEVREKEERERIEKERKESRDRRWGGSGSESGRDREPRRSLDRKDKDKDKERDRRERSRSRDKKRRDDKKRKSKSRSPRRRSRSRDRDRKDRDRKDDRKRDRDSSRDRKSRKHSDDKKSSRRSRSRSRDRHHRRRSPRSTSRGVRDKDRSDRSSSRRHRGDKDKERERDRRPDRKDSKEKQEDWEEKATSSTAAVAQDVPEKTESPKKEDTSIELGECVEGNSEPMDEDHQEREPIDVPDATTIASEAQSQPEMKDSPGPDNKDKNSSSPTQEDSIPE